MPSYAIITPTEDEAVDSDDVEALFPATVAEDGTVKRNDKTKIRLKKDCGLYMEPPHLSLRLGA